MAENTVNQRLKFLMDALGMKAGAFSRALGISETNIRNYTDRTSKPGFEALEKIALTFKQVNLAWLVTGEGEPLLTDTTSDQSTTTNAKKNSGNIQNNAGNAQVTNNIKLEECQRDLEAIRKDAAAYQREIALLQGQLKDKEEIITLLRASFTRPN